MELQKLAKTDRLIHTRDLIEGYMATKGTTAEEAGEVVLSLVQKAGVTLYCFPPESPLAQEIRPEMIEAFWREAPRQELIRDDHLAISVDDVPRILGFKLPKGVALARAPCRTANTTALPTPQGEGHMSDSLRLLNHAARRWWANADKTDPSTHPNNVDVAAWLTERGMSKSLAKHAATIIRPEWAHTGRKPDA